MLHDKRVVCVIHCTWDKQRPIESTIMKPKAYLKENT